MNTHSRTRRFKFFPMLLLTLIAILPMGCQQIGSAKDSIVLHFKNDETTLLDKFNPFVFLANKPNTEAMVMAPTQNPTSTQLPWIVRDAKAYSSDPENEQFAIAVPTKQTELTDTSERYEPIIDITPPSPAFTFADPNAPTTTNDLYLGFEVLNRTADKLLEQHQILIPQAPAPAQSQLTSNHIYQISLQCAARLRAAGQLHNTFALPTITATPGFYQPRDSQIILEFMRYNLYQLDPTVQIESPSLSDSSTDKTSTEVFNLAAQVLVKLAALAQQPITPGDLTTQFSRITADAKSLLRHANPNSAYRVDAPLSEPGQSTAHLYQQALALRQLINTKHNDLNSTFILPAISSDVTHTDTFIQTIITLADINQLKHTLGATEITPLLSASPQATSTDAHQQASLANYLFLQL